MFACCCFAADADAAGSVVSLGI